MPPCSCRLLLRPPALAAASLPFLSNHAHHRSLTHATRLLSLPSTAVHWTLLLRAPVLSQPPTFASTHAFRSWDPSSSEVAGSSARASSASVDRTMEEEKDERHKWKESKLRSSSSAAAASDTGTTTTSATAMSHPYSVRAYRARLQHGNFASLRELARAAYAPSPLTVLVDLLRLSLEPFTDEDQRMSPSPRVGIQRALERATDVQWVLSATVAEAQDTVLAAETVGDAASHAALSELLDQIEGFADAIDDCVRGTAAVPRLPGGDHAPRLDVVPQIGAGNETVSGKDVTADAGSSTWQLPTSTHATLLRGVLQLAAITGAHLQALTALDELIALQERQDRSASRSSSRRSSAAESAENVVEDEVDNSFSMDDALALVDAAAQRHIQPLCAQDHLYAMQACAQEHHRDFRTALSLYRRFVQQVMAGCFAAKAADFTTALVALAHSSRTTTDFAELRALLVESEAAAAVPVSVPLYTALIDAASRAVEEPQRMSIALSLYRRLRDGALTPSAETYAALIACCASAREPTHAFAFYHEARQVCGVSSFPPRVYTNLLLSYSTAGYGSDARKTLDVLVDAGAPLTRASFHAALASAVTVREAQEIMTLMTDRYHITPTPHTYAYVVQAIARQPAGLSTALQLFDVHEDALRALTRISSTVHGGGQRANGQGKSSSAGGDEFALSTSADGVALEPLLLEQYPLYVRAVEHALMRLRVDPAQDPRLKAYLTPLVRIAQQRMNAFTGMPPQSPIRVPAKEQLCIAVLAADVLANVDEWVLPFMSYYSVLVVPYSALLSLQSGGGRRVDGAMAKGAAAGLHDAVWQETAGGEEHDAIVEHRRRRLARFLAEHRDVLHLMSLEEELRWSRETRRYGVGITDLFARAAAVTLHLARRSDEAEENAMRGGGGDCCGGSDSVYARHGDASVVLVSANYEKCGRYVVALKQQQQQQHGTKGGKGSAGLQAALRRVSYHNPRTNPNWVPPSLSITRQQKEQQQHDVEASDDAGKAEAKRSVSRAAAAVVDAGAASQLYRRLLDAAGNTDQFRGENEDSEWRREGEKLSDARNKASESKPSASLHAAATRGAEEEMDAALLMSFLND